MWEAGSEITLFADGTVWLSQELGIGFGAKVALWHRVVPNGEVAKAKSCTTTFKAAHAGRLQLVTKPPGDFWIAPALSIRNSPRAGASGSLLVVVLVWKGSATDGLARLAQTRRQQLCRARAFAPRKSIEEPNGWHHLWRLGAGEIFSAAREGQHRLCCLTDRDVGILQYPVDVALDDRGVRLEWSLRVTALPSEKPEDTLPTHDYLSIAVEFDNGQDLTYMWSASLPAGHGFRCPLPWWNVRETHKVVRSGFRRARRWSERIAERAQGSTARRSAAQSPNALLPFGLIAVSLFHGGNGRMRIRRHPPALQTARSIIGP